MDPELKKDREKARSVIKNGVKSLNQAKGSPFHSPSTDIEHWNVCEEVFMAALDTHELDICETLMKDMEAQFPSSQRVMSLKGLLWEAKGSTKKASEVYDKLTEINEGHTLAMKRRVCLLMSTGKTAEAIKALVNYLEDFGADSEGWKQLALLYLGEGEIRNAVFCFEELLLANPHSYLSHSVLAEALYSLGQDVENVVLSQKYFCQSLLLKKSNARSLFGLAVTTVALSDFVESAKKSSDRAIVDVEKNLELNSKAITEISKLPMVAGLDGIVKAAVKRFSLA